jgi:nucleoside-diphosphate-sugar epimerase
MDIERELLDARIASGLSPEELSGKTVLITGAAGLIGYNLALLLLSLRNTLKEPPRVVALVRNAEKARRLFGARCGELELLTGDVTQPIAAPETVDYVIHAAGPTASRQFVEQPVETICTALDGTRNVLALAEEKRVRSMVYLSSMEVYGAPDTEGKITEAYGAELNTMAARSSYPESKRLCETLCRAYADEYGVNAKAIRLTQTFGPGAAYDDTRVFAEFARCAVENRDIVLHTAGQTKRSYLYTADAATAILTVLLKGEKGEAYNAANEATYCSVRDMAELVAAKCADGRIKVVCDGAAEGFGYAPTLKMDLDAGKLRALGWRPTVGLESAFNGLIEWYRKLRQS